MQKDVSHEKKPGLPYSCVVILNLILLSNCYTEGNSISTPFKKTIDFPDHTDVYEDTLIWAVKFQTGNVQEKLINDDHLENFDVWENKRLEDSDYKREVLSIAKHVADQEGLIFLGEVGEIIGVFLFGYAFKELNYSWNDGKSEESIPLKDLQNWHISNYNEENHEKLKVDLELKFDKHPNIVLHSRQKIVSRQKRCSHNLKFQDPRFKDQWHLCNRQNARMDINVTGVWEHNVTGAGVTVAVVDDGLEWTNPDLQDNYSPEGSWDLNSNDPDPMPSNNVVTNHHGTRCAGEIAAVKNSVCGVGVAYDAKISGVRVLDGPMTDSLEAAAFNKNFQINDIYSCSWGPDDDGKTVDGPHILAKAAMQYGINFGRKGYGSIYVVASGNGGRSHDNCNFDGYANSLYTVTIGAVDERGHMPFYAEECASMLAVTFSSGTHLPQRSIVTTDWTLHGGKGCTTRHTGTSAAAPIAAGMIALMLQVRPCLSWRDVQYLIAMTAQKVDVNESDWQRNGAGLYHSHKHGFGLMRAWRLVNAAKIWEMVPWLTSFVHSSTKNNLQIPKSSADPLVISYTLTDSTIRGYDLYILEHVQVKVSITHPRRGMLEIILECPSGTKSVIAAPRPLDNARTLKYHVIARRYSPSRHIILTLGQPVKVNINESPKRYHAILVCMVERGDIFKEQCSVVQSSTKGFSDWTFSTVRCWGERPVGTWKLVVADTDMDSFGHGTINNWQLKLYGTPMTPEHFESRRRLVHKAGSGEYLNDSFELPCPPPQVLAKPDVPISLKTLKVIALAGIFLFVMAVYESFESLFCYKDEKKEQQRRTRLTKVARHLSSRDVRSERSLDPSECRALLAEEEHIPLEIISTNQIHDTIENKNYNEDETCASIGEQTTVNYANDENNREMFGKVTTVNSLDKGAHNAELSNSECDLSND